MKNYKKTFEMINFCKVATLCIAGFYCFFWMYRFLNGPLTDIIYPIVDITVFPIKTFVETVSIYQDRVIEMAYFFMALIFAGFSFLLGRLESVVAEMQRRDEIREIIQKRKNEVRINKELEREHQENIRKYKYISLFIRYRLTFASDILTQDTKITLTEILRRSYANTISLLQQRLKNCVINQYGDSVFVQKFDFENFDEFMSYILDAIKVTKLQNSNDIIDTDFMLLIDAQMNRGSSDKSYETFVKIADGGYYNMAMVTLPFKIRFDLMQKHSKYITELSGFEVMTDTGSNEYDELYVLRSRRRA